MLCHQCGSPVEKTDKICPNCGADLVKSVRRFDIAQSKGLRISQQIKAIKLDAQLFPPGEKIADRFVLAEMIGKGPFGEVYRAIDELIDDDVAVKIYRKELIKKPQAHEQFLRVTRSARSLDQANVVRLHGSGVHKNHPWVSMQYLEGLSLRKVMNLRRSKDENFSLEEIEPMVSQVTAALEHVKREGVHGDLKPENIIFMPDLIKVSDAYLYAALDAPDFVAGVEDSHYVAPELLSEDDHSERADVYSLGVIIGEMVFGADYEADTNVSGELGAVDALCKRATAFDPQERYSSVKALARELSTLAKTGSILSNPPPPPAAGSPPAAGPPAAPPSAPPTSPKDDYEEATESQIIEVSDEELATLDFSRSSDLEIQDLLPTNEVDREKHPVPPTQRSVTKTAITAPPQGKPANQPASSAKWPIILVLLVAAAVVVAMSMNGNKKKEVVDLGAKANGMKIVEPVKPEPIKADPIIPPVPPVEVKENPQFVASAMMASSTIERAQTKALSTIPVPAVVQDTPEKVEGGTDAVAVIPDPKVKVDPKPAVLVEKKPDPKPAVKPGAGTGCPSGMVLVKSKKNGNVCIDQFEYPGRSIKPKNVNWFEAKKKCESKGKRLCSLKEWRRACGSKYPYGRKFDPSKCNTVDEDGFERSVAKAGAFKRCRSRSGAYDMSGNVFEWVQEQRVAGGSFESDEDMATCRYASSKSPRSAGGDVGFRCCKNPE